MSAAELYTEDDRITSLVSYPSRCKEWGSSKYRGNCDGRLFKDLVLRYGARKVADPMEGSGTTRDVISGLNASGHSIDYWGGDLKDGFNLLTDDLPGRYDLVWIHPPYWNIIQYTEHPGDLSGFKKYANFRAALEQCLKKCAAALLPNGRLVVLVGDVRRRGVYTPIIHDVLNLNGELGDLQSVIIKAQHRCRSDGYAYGRKLENVPIKHEYCLVFRCIEEPRRKKK